MVARGKRETKGEADARGKARENGRDISAILNLLGAAAKDASVSSAAAILDRAIFLWTFCEVQTHVWQCARNASRRACLISVLSNRYQHVHANRTPHGSAITRGARRYLDDAPCTRDKRARPPPLRRVLFTNAREPVSLAPFFVSVTPRCPVTVGRLHVSISTLTAGNGEVSRVRHTRNSRRSLHRPAAFPRTRMHPARARAHTHRQGYRYA